LAGVFYRTYILQGL